MKALTLTAPWGTLTAIGAKHIETRSWSTTYRGALAIHQAAGLGPVGGKPGYLDLCRTPPFFTELIRHQPNQGGMFYDDDFFLSLPRGAIVAVCRLVECMEIDGAPTGFAVHGPADTQVWWRTRDEIAFGDYTPGRYAWLLADVRALPEPIPCRGAIGLWTVPADIAARLEAL